MSNTAISPFIKAVKDKDIVECRRLIESEEADIHQKDAFGFSPILWGSRRGYWDIVDILLSKGADIHDKNNDGCSSIIDASRNGHTNVVDLLLSKGANLYESDNFGNTCFSWAQLLDSKNPNINRKHGLLYRLLKFPTTMAILVLQELSLYYLIDCSSLIDLYHYIGTELFTLDNAEDEKKKVNLRDFIKNH